MNTKTASFFESLYPVFFAAGYYLFMISLERSLGVEAAPLVSKAFLLASVIFLFASGKLVEGNVLISIAAVAVVMLSAVFTDYYYFEWSVLFFSINQVVTLFLFLSVRPSFWQKLCVLKIIAWAPLFSLVVGVFYQAIGVGDVFGIDEVNNASRLQGSTIPAFLAGVALSGVFSSILLYFFHNKNFGFLLLFNFVVVLLTAARMPIFLCGVILVVSFLLLDRGGADRKMIFGSLFFGFCAVFLVFFGQAVFARFGSEGSSGRDIIWEYLTSLMNDYWGFGIGFGHSFSAVPRDVSILVGGASAAHNEYIRIAVEIGVVQAWVFYTLLVIALVKLGCGIRGVERLVYFSGCFLFFVFCYTDNVISTPVCYPLLLVSLYGASLNKLQPDAEC